jgi:hypothetical protein
MDEDDLGRPLKSVLDEGETGQGQSKSQLRMVIMKTAKLRKFYALTLFLCEL